MTPLPASPLCLFVFFLFHMDTQTPQLYNILPGREREKERKSKLNLETTKKGGQRGVKLCISMEISKTLLLFPSLSSAEEGSRRGRGEVKPSSPMPCVLFFHCLSDPNGRFFLCHVLSSPLLSSFLCFAFQCLTTKEKKYRLKYHNLISIATN